MWNFVFVNEVIHVCYLLVAGGIHEGVPEMGVVDLNPHHGCRSLPSLALEDGVSGRHLEQRRHYLSSSVDLNLKGTVSRDGG
jgi:hypothetical protein